MADSVTRYDVYGFDDHGNDTIRALPDPTGEWCRYSDVAPIVERCERLAAALRSIAEGCSFPEDDVQRAIRDRARAALSEKGEP